MFLQKARNTEIDRLFDKDMDALTGRESWASLPQDFLSDHLVPRLPVASKQSAHLVCRSWAAGVVHGCKSLTIRRPDEAPRDWGSRFSGLRSVVWSPSERNALSAHTELHSLTALTSLSVRNAADDDLTALCALTRLLSLDLGDCSRVTDEGLSCLRQLTALARLDLGKGARITDRGVQELRHLRSVTTLALGGCPCITDEGLGALWPLPGLTDLRVAGGQSITDSALVGRSPLPLLTAVTLGRGITDLGIAALRPWTRLASLELIHCSSVTDRGLLDLRHLTSLASLRLEYCSRVTDSGLEGLSSLTGLSSLSLVWCGGVTGTSLTSLAPLSSLSTLKIDSCYGFTDDGISALLSSCNSLTSLGLTHLEHVTDLGFRDLSSLKGGSLTALDIRCCPGLKDAGLSSALSISSLASLDASFCRGFSDAALTGSLGNLTSLSLTPGAAVTARGLSSLSELTSLKSLRLAENHAVEDELLLVALRSCASSLTALDVSGTSVRGPGLRPLAALTSLDLSFCCRLGCSEGGLGTAVAGLLGLERLRIAGCAGFTDNVLLKALKPLNCLTSLDIDLCNNITIHGLSDLRRAVKNLRDIKHHLQPASDGGDDSHW